VITRDMLLAEIADIRHETDELWSEVSTTSDGSVPLRGTLTRMEELASAAELAAALGATPDDALWLWGAWCDARQDAQDQIWVAATGVSPTLRRAARGMT
jgi:hypothetical protein